MTRRRSARCRSSDPQSFPVSGADAERVSGALLFQLGEDQFDLFLKVKRADIRIALQEYPHKKIEVVFVDSMSTDGTYEKMMRFKNTDYGFRDVKIVRCQKRNQASSWNEALKVFTGDVVIRVDAHARIRATLFLAMFIICASAKTWSAAADRTSAPTSARGSLLCWRPRIRCSAAPSRAIAVRQPKRSIWTAFSTPRTAAR